MKQIRRCVHTGAVRPRLFIRDHYTAYNDLRVIVFGAGGFLGEMMTTVFGKLGARLTYPVRGSYKYVEYLKVGASYRDVAVMQSQNFEDPDIFDKLISDHNVVINLIGGKNYQKKFDFHYEANVTLASRIAQAVARNPGVSRFIHFSAAGADPYSPSIRMQTKWMGEQEVLKHFPETTILRPCHVFGEGDEFAYRLAQINQMMGFMPVVGDAQCLRQPVYMDDVTLCVKNALLLEESIGQIYELGGPQVYTLQECIEIIYDKINKMPRVKSIPYSWAHRFFKAWPHYHGFNRFINHVDVEESQLDIVVSGQNKTIADLKVVPVSFPQPLHWLLMDFYTRYAFTEEQKEHGEWTGHDRRYG